MLFKYSTEIADILHAAAHSNLTDRKTGRREKLLCPGHSSLKDIFSCLETCYGLELAVQLYTTEASAIYPWSR